jgi:hypothetical protein
VLAVTVIKITFYPSDSYYLVNIREGKQPVSEITEVSPIPANTLDKLFDRYGNTNKNKYEKAGPREENASSNPE